MRANIPFKNLEDAKAKCLVSASGCWLWQGSKDSRGYGQRHVRQKMTLVHREVYALHNGTIPTGLHCCHKCDTPACINPDHIFLGTPKDNAKDSANKGRRSCRKLSPEQVAKIRRLRKQGLSQSAIAQQFGVGQPTVSDILAGVTWSNSQNKEVARV